MSCLDDELVLDLVEGRLPAPALATVDDHLDTCDRCRDLVAHLARARSPSTVLTRGQTLGRYVVGDLLGTGAMGRVYSAWQPELDRRVAIKVLREDGLELRARLLREAQAMARLDHPNIVGVHEVGTTDDGVYVAMELVEGDTLRGWSETGRPLRELVQLLVEVARGLAAVHAAGLVHRDVKPDNIIVGTDGRARLGDFGLARTGSSPEPATASPQLATGSKDTTIAGTPVYMAPELLRGGSATAASDQFSFGVTAYELAGGKRPFEGTTWAELLRASDSSPPPLRGAPAWLDAAIRRCLSPDPSRRFASVAAVADHLATHANRRRPARWLAGVATAAVVASGATWLAVRPGSSTAVASTCDGSAEIARVWTPDRFATLDQPTRNAIDRWTGAWAAAKTSTCEANHEPAPRIAARTRCLDRSRDELAALLDRVNTTSSGGTTSPGRTTSTGGTTSPAGRLIDALAAEPPTACLALDADAADPMPLDPEKAARVGEVEQNLPAVRAAIALGDARPVVTTLAKLVEQARASGHAPTLAEVQLVDAEAKRATSQLDGANLAAREALASAERGHADQLAARAWMLRVAIAGDRRDLAAVEDLAAVAAGAIDRIGAPANHVAQLLRLRALVAYNRGQLAEARAMLLEARGKLVLLSGERSVEISAIESALGTVARGAGELDVAEQHHELALAIDRELRGAEHPDVARDLHNLAGVLRMRGQLDRARQTYRDALAIETKARGETSVERGLTLNSLGLVELARKDLAAAKRAFTEADRILGGAGHGDRAFPIHNLGIVAAAEGDHRAALASYARARTIYDDTIGADAMAPIRLFLDAARSEAALGHLVTARADATRAQDAATRANLGWIADDARAFLTDPKTRPRVAAVESTADTRLVPEAPPAIPATTPAKTKPATKTGRDVGVYGPNQDWTPPAQPVREPGAASSSQGW